MQLTTPLSLKEIQVKLGVEPHVLIHLCEKEVVIPDILDAKGRGSMRLFSERNIFEFMVALRLRRYEIPVKVISIVTRLLREFETAVGNLEVGAKESKFELPRSLLERNSPNVALHFIDGRLLIMSIKAGRGSSFLGIDVGSSPSAAGKVHIKRFDGLPEAYETCLSVNLTELAKKLGQQPKKPKSR